MSGIALSRLLLRALSDAARALQDFLRGFTGLAGAPTTADAAARHELEEEAARRPRCC